jgi:heme-degrading monooxygenase HmoA
MFARVERFETNPEQVEELLTVQQKTVALARQLPGNMGGFLLVSRETCKAMSVTYWESEEDRATAESEFSAAPVRGDVELYDVAAQRAMHT